MTNQPGWRKSSYSNGASACVEVRADEDEVLIRESDDPTKQLVATSPANWAAFITGVKAGEFDDLAGAFIPEVDVVGPLLPSWTVTVDGQPVAAGLNPDDAADLFRRTAASRSPGQVIEVAEVVDGTGELG